jgi:hypothetical protein
MSRYLSFTSVFFLIFLISCQKEKSFEQGQLAKGSLQDSLGNCLLKTIAGTYTANKALADSNFIEVNVDVTQTGRYTIYTDTINGYFFRGTGVFTKLGTNTVTIKGSGTPGSAGTNDFTVFFDSSLCNVSVTVLPNTGGSSGTAVYTLQGTGSSCMNATPSGTYTQGVVLTSSNKIDIQVNVTTVGTWSITTSAVAGFSFSGSGTFTNTGIQTITLIGSGTPNASGAQTFPVTAGSSSCSFDITVQAGSSGGTTSSTDYFPLTQNSYWTYDGASGDTLKTTVSGSATLGGKTYQRFVSVYESGPPNDTSYYRKDNTTNFYYTYLDTSYFSGIGLKFNQPGLDVLFLKNSLTTGATWNSDFNASFSGVPVTVRFKFTCANASASVTANGNTFSNVYQVTLVIQLGVGGSFQDLSTQDFYYAKGVGLIKISDPVNGDQVIRNWQVL